MSIIQTALVFVGIPAAIVLLVVFAVYGKSMLHQPNRYRPGRPWNFEPEWFVPHPDAITHAGERPALTPGATTAVGGASGEW
ncbi:MAG: aa3-type cytochrome oxidase subunit CtaJ [Jatrophihabitantaceae bacterium]